MNILSGILQEKKRANLFYQTLENFIQSKSWMDELYYTANV